MNLEKLLTLVDLSLASAVPESIMEYCGQYFSPYYMLMHYLAMDVTTGICVELGVESGRASNAMLLAGAYVYGVDNNPDRKDVLADRPNFTMIIGSSLPVPDEISRHGKSIAVLHIDTEHSFSQAQSEFNAYRPFLQDGAVVLFDDTNAMEGEVLRYLNSLPYEKFVDDRLHPSCGFGGIIYRENA